MNPNSKQKRIAFGYNRDYGKIVLNEGQAAAGYFGGNEYSFSIQQADLRQANVIQPAV